jgi:hypothetical protein
MTQKAVMLLRTDLLAWLPIIIGLTNFQTFDHHK